MDKKAKILDDLIEKQGYSRRAFAEKIGVPATTLQSILTRGVGKASVDNIIKICQELGITVEEMERMAEGKKDIEFPELTKKDERDIQKRLQEMIDDLGNQEAYAAFDGQSFEDMDEEDRELLIASLENSLRLAKRLAKQKFTPKKYR